MNQTIHRILKGQADRFPNKEAIRAPGRTALDYQSLTLQVDSIVERLNTLGIGRGERVAIVLPNGPEMAVAFLAVASCATSAPLNPAYRASEFDFYLSDLNARALMLAEGVNSPAREIAQARGIPILEVTRKPDDAAGVFHLTETSGGTASVASFAGPDDVALVLHTSGTTSRPKIVPLTHRNICTSAFNTATTLQLTEDDCCLNVMPLFHIHGLMAAVLAKLTPFREVAYFQHLTVIHARRNRSA